MKSLKLAIKSSMLFEKQIDIIISKQRKMKILISQYAKQNYKSITFKQKYKLLRTSYI